MDLDDEEIEFIASAVRATQSPFGVLERTVLNYISMFRQYSVEQEVEYKMKLREGLKQARNSSFIKKERLKFFVPEKWAGCCDFGCSRSLSTQQITVPELTSVIMEAGPFSSVTVPQLCDWFEWRRPLVNRQQVKLQIQTLLAELATAGNLESRGELHYLKHVDPSWRTVLNFHKVYLLSQKAKELAPSVSVASPFRHPAISLTIPQCPMPIWTPNIPVVMDGSNLCRRHGEGEFSPAGMVLAANYFLRKSYRPEDISIILPEDRKEQANGDLFMTSLIQAGILHFTPMVVRNERSVLSYDDRYQLTLAARVNGVVVSRDQFQDLARESEVFRTIAATRVVKFYFDRDEFMLSPDPYGRNGPRLADILGERFAPGEV